MELRGHCEAVEPQEPIVTLWAPMDPKVHFDIAGPHGILESTVTLWGLVELSGPAGPHGTNETP